MAEIDVEVDCPITTPTNGNHSSWISRNARRVAERKATVVAIGDIPTPQWTHYYVTLVRMGPMLLDDDNLRGAFKSIRDQLAQWIGYDDADPRITWDYAQLRAKMPARPREKTRFKTWARIRLTPTPQDFVQDESMRRITAHRREPSELAPGRQPRYVQKPKAVPELAGGKPVRVIAVHPRNNGPQSQIRVRLMRNTRIRGVGLGVMYTHVAVYWQDPRNKLHWRSQGVAVRLEEIHDVVAALLELARSAGVPGGEVPRGVQKISTLMPRRADSPSDDVNKEASTDLFAAPNNPFPDASLSRGEKHTVNPLLNVWRARYPSGDGKT